MAIREKRDGLPAQNHGETVITKSELKKFQLIYVMYVNTRILMASRLSLLQSTNTSHDTLVALLQEK
jgi:hypothetical protein